MKVGKVVTIPLAPPPRRSTWPSASAPMDLLAAWDEFALWLDSVVRSQRWTDISPDRRVAVLADTAG
jgi:hypothetical protein